MCVPQLGLYHEEKRKQRRYTQREKKEDIYKADDNVEIVTAKRMNKRQGNMMSPLN